MLDKMYEKEVENRLSDHGAFWSEYDDGYLDGIKICIDRIKENECLD